MIKKGSLSSIRGIGLVDMTSKLPEKHFPTAQLDRILAGAKNSQDNLKSLIFLLVLVKDN